MNYANPQIEEIFTKLETGIMSAIDFLKGEYSLMRAGKANPKLLERITVDYYGAVTPIMQMGNISNPEPKMLVISLWDKSALKSVEKAILAANIGVTPMNDGTVIRLTFPDVTEERRKELVKQVKKMGEDCKVVIRNERRDAIERLKKVKTDKIISEDLVADYEKEVDKISNKNIELVDKTIKEKEADIMAI